MSPGARKSLLIGGALMLAIPFVAGLLRRNAIVLPRPAMIGLVILAGALAIVGAVIAFRGSRSSEEQR